MKKIFGQNGLIAKRLFGLGRDEDYFGMSTYGTDIKAYRNLETYKGIVYACINLISEQMGSYHPVMNKEIKGKLEQVDDPTGFFDLLHNPGGKDNKAIPISMFSLLYATAAFIELQGDVYWYMAKGQVSGKPREIVILRADTVGRELDEKGNIEYFFLKTYDGQRIRMEIDEVLPFVGFNPKSAYTGIGTVDASKDYIQTDEFSTLFTKNFFKNNAGVSGIIELAGMVTPGAFKKFVRAWRSKHEGVGNAGKTAIIRASEAKFTKIGLGLDELDMGALRKMSMEDIAMMFRVPLALLGKLTEGTGLGRANIETLEYVFAKYNIEPKMKKLDAILQFALERYYQVTDLKISHANIIPEDKEFELNERDKGVDRWMTRNEIRQEEGLGSIDGGDQLYIPFNNIPLDESSSDVTSSTAATTGKAISITIRKHVKPGEIVIKRRVTAKKKDTNKLEIPVTVKENFRLSIMRSQKLYEKRYKAKVEPILNSQKQEALDNLEAHSNAKHLTKDFQLNLFDDAAADSLMGDKLNPVLFELAQQQGALGLAFAGDDTTEFKLTARFDDIVRRGTLRMAKNFNDETLTLLNETLTEGITAGESIGKLKGRVESVYSDATGYRASRISRTETLKASNEATNEAYRQTGYVTGKQWYVNPGADEECAAFDGKVIGLDDTFVKQGESFSFTDTNGDEQSMTNDYDDVDSPPLHPNCRCVIIPIR